MESSVILLYDNHTVKDLSIVLSEMTEMCLCEEGMMSYLKGASVLLV